MNWTKADEVYALRSFLFECRVTTLRVRDGLPPGLPVARLHQVHSGVVHRVSIPCVLEGDGLVTDTPGLLLLLRVADCLPVFFWSRDGSAVGICHAGWRGTVTRIAQRLVGVMAKEFGTTPRGTSLS